MASATSYPSKSRSVLHQSNDVHIKTAIGRPTPLGPSLYDPLKSTMHGVNFAVYSRHAKRVFLCLFNKTKADECDDVIEVEMTRGQGNGGEDFVWHVALPELETSDVEYGVRVEGEKEGDWTEGHRWKNGAVLLDPYAPIVTSGRKQFGVRSEEEKFRGFRGSFNLTDGKQKNKEFNWGKGYAKPEHNWEDLIIYEMGLRSYTADKSSGLKDKERGTYRGLIQKIPHLKNLGITAVELLPIFEYDELEFQRKPNPRDHMTNIWGYSHISFFAPMSRFASDPSNASDEFKEMVRELHKAKIEVFLDVVYNHTAEGGDVDPYLLSFRGIDNKTYYMLDANDKNKLLNYSGCGNTINANNLHVRQLILDSLRHWVQEYHIDGFRFDLASALTRGEDGEPIPAPPLIREISSDPVLLNTKLIAEPWDCGGLYQVGSFPSWDRWAEWNGMYRDDFRRFIRGDEGMKRAVATRLAGSSDLYNYLNRKPYHSINFIIAHDGFTLRDLVSYNTKRNSANGEEGRDGCNDNFSWNTGYEGETEDVNVECLRWRQMKNFHVALMCSQGTPMIHMGDEYGRSSSSDERYHYY